MVAFSLAPTRVQRPLANEPMRGLADISYSVYLIHFAVIWFALSQLSLPQDGSLWSAVAWSALVFPASRSSTRFCRRTCWSGRSGAGRSDSAAGRGPPRPRAGVAASAADPGAAGLGASSRPTTAPAGCASAMDSVLAQDYPNLELVVVDDGSTDETPACSRTTRERHPPERFRFMRQENAGQANALNRGNALARGEILGYLSDDDLLAPSAVSRLTRELVADPEVAVAYPAYFLIDEAGVVEDVVRPIEYSPVAALRLHDTIIGPGGLARRWALEAAGGWDPSYRWMGDLILWMGVGIAGRSIRVDEPLASWRKHSGSVTIELSPDHAREHLAVVRARSARWRSSPPLSSAPSQRPFGTPACLGRSLAARAGPGPRSASSRSTSIGSGSRRGRRARR